MEYSLMKGNEAIAEAALRAGCRFYAGYPITPQSEILEYMADHMEERGGVFIQGENEIASMSMVYGAAACGARCMSSSSGPGFDLKQEEISYLSAAGLPAVIVNAMRYGLGDGEITAGQDSYWVSTRGGGHGDLCPDNRAGGRKPFVRLNQNSPPEKNTGARHGDRLQRNCDGEGHGRGRNRHRRAVRQNV